MTAANEPNFRGHADARRARRPSRPASRATSLGHARVDLRATVRHGAAPREPGTSAWIVVGAVGSLIGRFSLNHVLPVRLQLGEALQLLAADLAEAADEELHHRDHLVGVPRLDADDVERQLRVLEGEVHVGVRRRRVDVGVDAVDVAREHGLELGRERLEEHLPLGGRVVDGADLLVLAEGGGVDLGEAAGGRAPERLHLEEPVLRHGEALAEEHGGLRLGGDVRRAEVVAVDGDGGAVGGFEGEVRGGLPVRGGEGEDGQHEQHAEADVAVDHSGSVVVN